MPDEESARGMLEGLGVGRQDLAGVDDTWIGPLRACGHGSPLLVAVASRRYQGTGDTVSSSSEGDWCY